MNVALMDNKGMNHHAVVEQVKPEKVKSFGREPSATAWDGRRMDMTFSFGTEAARDRFTLRCRNQGHTVATFYDER